MRVRLFGRRRAQPASGGAPSGSGPDAPAPGGDVGTESRTGSGRAGAEPGDVDGGRGSEAQAAARPASGEIAGGARAPEAEVAAGPATAPEVAAGSATAPEVAAGSATAPEVAAGSATAPEVAAGSATVAADGVEAEVTADVPEETSDRAWFDRAPSGAHAAGDDDRSGPNDRDGPEERGQPRRPRPAVRWSEVKIFAVANQKGGVGKTTTAVNLAACIAEAGYPTLLIDVDPQANATVGLGAARDLRPSVYDVLAGECEAGAAIHRTAVEGLSLMPAGAGLAGANVELPRVSGSEALLRDALGRLDERFAFVLLDCPPSLGPLTVNALVAADRLIVPVQTEYYALEGLAALLDTVGLVQRELNPRLRVAGMLLTMHDNRTRLARDVAAEVRQHFPELLFDTVIPRNVRISEAPSFGVPITVHDPHCAGADAYVALAREVAALA